jgi:hypothetical protein
MAIAIELKREVAGFDKRVALPKPAVKLEAIAMRIKKDYLRIDLVWVEWYSIAKATHFIVGLKKRFVSEVSNPGPQSIISGERIKHFSVTRMVVSAPLRAAVTPQQPIAGAVLNASARTSLVAV